MADPLSAADEVSRQVSVVPLQEIFAAPLRAVIQADFMAAEQFVHFVRTYGFDRARAGTPSTPVDTKFGALRMISFQFPRPGREGTPEDVTVRIPALSMIPLPLLQVRDADFRFGVRLLQGAEAVPAVRRLGLLDDEDEDPTPGQVHWQAMIASSHPDDQPNTGDVLAPQLQANIHARVRMRQADVPAGIANLLALMGQNTEIETRPRLTAPEPQDALP
jgi:hypothetical protein